MGIWVIICIQEPSHHTLQTFRPLRMFMIVLRDTPLTHSCPNLFSYQNFEINLVLCKQVLRSALVVFFLLNQASVYQNKAGKICCHWDDLISVTMQFCMQVAS